MKTWFVIVMAVCMPVVFGLHLAGAAEASQGGQAAGLVTDGQFYATQGKYDLAVLRFKRALSLTSDAATADKIIGMLVSAAMRQRGNTKTEAELRAEEEAQWKQAKELRQVTDKIRARQATEPPPEPARPITREEQRRDIKQAMKIHNRTVEDVRHLYESGQIPKFEYDRRMEILRQQRYQLEDNHEAIHGY